MSWMDSWSRPTKTQATPVPYYLLDEATPYCHSCGRVIGSRRTTAVAKQITPVKYCSSRCRGHKPGKLDREIEQAFVKFLTGEEALDEEANKGPKNAKKKKQAKGDPRVMVRCDTVGKVVFGDHDATSEKEDSHSEDDTSFEDTAGGPEPEIDGDVLARMSVRSGTRIRPAQSVSEVNGSVGGEKGRAEHITETDEMLEKRREGQRHANEREMVRRAARRGVAFGFSVSQDKGEDVERRKCEAVMNGKVVEPSFAKGNWGIRWRE